METFDEIIKDFYDGMDGQLAELENFKNKCVCCKRYRNGKCSILIKAIEGRIQQEIKNDICLKFENKRRNSK